MTPPIRPVGRSVNRMVGSSVGLLHNFLKGWIVTHSHTPIRTLVNLYPASRTWTGCPRGRRWPTPPPSSRPSRRSTSWAAPGWPWAAPILAPWPLGSGSSIPTSFKALCPPQDLSSKTQGYFLIYIHVCTYIHKYMYIYCLSHLFLFFFSFLSYRINFVLSSGPRLIFSSTWTSSSLQWTVSTINVLQLSRVPSSQ